MQKNFIENIFNREATNLNNTLNLKISIITVCKNSQQFLNETISSVVNQQYKNIEYIIIDGKSTDLTINIIKQYVTHIAFWISEEDEGMYDAINKGLKLANGDYILILNSDDVLAHKNIIADVVKEIKKERLDYYYGNIIKLKKEKCKAVKLFNVNYQQLLFSTHGTFAPHPCFFISKQLNIKLGGYDLTYKYASDYDYILRALGTKDTKGKHLDLYITRFRIHNNSITASGKINGDRLNILLKNGYYKKACLKRIYYYYKLWIYYKIINSGQKFKAG